MKSFATDHRREKRRGFLDSTFGVVSLLVASLAIVILVVLISSILARGGGGLVIGGWSGFWQDGWQGIYWPLLTNEYVETNKDPAAEKSGIFQGMVGTAILCLVSGLVALPTGIGTAVFLEEFRPKNRVLLFWHSLIQLNINNLAGVPSVVYGMLGLTAFVYMFGVFGRVDVENPVSIELGVEYRFQVKTIGGSWVTFDCWDKNVSKIDPAEVPAGTVAQGPDGEEFVLKVMKPGEAAPTAEAQRLETIKSNALISRISLRKPYFFRLPFGKSVLAAGLTLALVILPIIIIAAQEAIRAVPDSLRVAAFGMGATRWQMIRETVLPSATPGIMTGAILAMSRAIGEAAPVLVIMGAIKSDAYSNLMDKASTMPVLIYGMASHSNNGYEPLAAAAIIVLLCVLLGMNSVAIVIRYLSERKTKQA